MIIDKTGDIFSTESKIIGHGVNCYGVMGAGIAVQFRDRSPEMYQAYIDLCESKEPEDMVGHVMLWTGPFYSCEEPFITANMFSQDRPGPNARYSWTISALKRTMEYAKDMGFDKVAIPQIGCGIGGLDFKELYYELLDNFAEHPVDLEVWTYGTD